MRRHSLFLTMLLLGLALAACSTSSTNPYGSGPLLFPGVDTGNGAGGTDGGAKADAVAAGDGGGAVDGAQAGEDGMNGDDAGTGGGDDAGAADTGAAIDSGGSATDAGNGTDAAATEDTSVVDAGEPDVAVTDVAVEDSDPGDAGSDTGGTGNGDDAGDPADAGNAVDAGGGTDPFGADVPWGSSDDVAPYDAGPTNYPDAGSGGGLPQICTPKVAELNLKEEKVGGKVDVIWWIDTSGSMSQEAKYLNDNINNFAKFIAGAAIDYRMILVGNGFGICVQPPLGGPGCTDGPNFFHVKQTIGSTNGPNILVQHYQKWGIHLRPDASKNIVAVTDDNQYSPPPCSTTCSTANGGQLGQPCSQCKAQWFLGELQKLDPVNFPQSPQAPYGVTHHSIVAYESKADCPTIAQKGAAYLEMTAMTGGAKFKVCETNWAPIFQALAQSVIKTAKPGCEYNIPFPQGIAPNPAIGLSYVAKDDLFSVPKAATNVCPVNGIGFTLDNLNAPSKVTLCPSSCDLLKGGGNIQFDFGCF